MHPDTLKYNESQSPNDRKICDLLSQEIDGNLADAENKIWHAHPVWFLDGNPIVGYSKLKSCIRLFFWSGASFDEKQLQMGTGKFKDASIRYTSTAEINTRDLKRWLDKARRTQWDYRNLIRNGRLERIK